MRRPRAEAQGPSRGDGGDRARADARGPNGARASWCRIRWPPTRSRRRFEALRAAAEDFNGRIRVDANVPYAEVKTAWERAAVGMVLTTGPEPFGRTALEALASGAALITSGRGGLAEICGPCAVTVDPGDADRLAAALGELLDAPERRAELARAGRERVEAAVRHPGRRAADGRFHRRLHRRGASVGGRNVLPFSRADGKAAQVTSSPTASEIRSACRRSAQNCARRGPVLARELLAVFRQLRDLRAALLRPAADARFRARLFHLSGRLEPLPVRDDRRSGGRDGLRRIAVGRLRAQGGHDRFARRRRRRRRSPSRCRRTG